MAYEAPLRHGGVRVVGEGQRRRVGHGAGQHAAQRQIVHFRQHAREDAHRQQRDGGDENTVSDPAQTIALGQGGDKVTPDFSPTTARNSTIPSSRSSGWRSAA